MFTGLVLETVLLRSIEPIENNAIKISIQSKQSKSQTWCLGDSIALNGVCLTIVDIKEVDSQTKEFFFELSSETLKLTSWKDLKVGATVHVEPALTMGDALGGHLVSGHVDSKATLVAKQKTEKFYFLKFELKGEAQKLVAPFIMNKSSITLDGVSLTVNGVEDHAHKTVFDICLIPHTLEITRFKNLNIGDEVNVEADMMAKYLCRFNDFQEKMKTN